MFILNLLTITNILEPPLSSETDSSDSDHKIFDKGLDTNTTDLNNNGTYPRDRPKEPIKSLVGDDVSTVDLVNLDLSEEQVIIRFCVTVTCFSLLKNSVPRNASN